MESNGGGKLAYFYSILYTVAVAQLSILSGCGLPNEHTTYPTWQCVRRTMKDVSVDIPQMSNVLYLSRQSSLTDNMIALVLECRSEENAILLKACGIDGKECHVETTNELARYMTRVGLPLHLASFPSSSVCVFRTTIASRTEETPWYVSVFVAPVSNNVTRTYFVGGQIYN